MKIYALNAETKLQHRLAGLTGVVATAASNRQPHSVGKRPPTNDSWEPARGSQRDGQRHHDAKAWIG